MTPSEAKPQLSGVADLPATEPPRGAMSVYVYELPVRIWHWVITGAIVVLSVTGYFIGAPPPSTGGEASEYFLFGYIRAAHFIAAYLFIFAMLGRTYWAIVGNKYAKQIYLVPFFSKDYWADLFLTIRFYLFMAKEQRRHVGHNPLARMSMFGLFLLSAFFLIFTGLALYGEGVGIESWQYRWFAWVFSIFGGSMQVHTAHHVGMWAMLIFVMAHVYALTREDILGRGSVVSTMVSGWRNFRDTRE